MKRTIALVVFLSLLITIVLAGRCNASTDQLYDATCRVTSGGGAGTGCAIKMNDTHVFVLTAKHILRGGNIKCEFWRAGHASKPMAARVYTTAGGQPGSNRDAALLVIDRNDFNGRLPQVIPLAPAGVNPSPGDTIYTVGCVDGSWATGVKGHYVKSTSDGMFTFQPNPAQGRSGSAILDYRGRYIIGILLAQNYNGNNGLATSADSIRAGLRNLVSSKATAQVHLAQYCPPGRQCAPQSSPPRGIYIGGQGDRLGISINREQGLRIGRGVYPTAPQEQPQTIPISPPVYVAPPVYIAPPVTPAPMNMILEVDMSGVSEALGKSADANTQMSNSISAYMDAKTAEIEAAKEAAAAAKNQQHAQQIVAQAPDVIKAGMEGYNEGGVLGAGKAIATSEATETIAKSLLMTLIPFPFNYLAVLGVGIALPFFRKKWAKKRDEEALDNRAKAIESSERTSADRLEEAKAMARVSANAAVKAGAEPPPVAGPVAPAPPP